MPATFDQSRHPRGHTGPDKRGATNPGEFGQGRGKAAQQKRNNGATKAQQPGRTAQSLGKTGALSALRRLGQAVLTGAHKLEHGATAFIVSQVAKLPGALRLPVIGAFRLSFASYSAAQAGVRAVARERGYTDAEADRVAHVVSVADVLVGAKGVPAALTAAGLGALALPASFLPIGSLSYLAYSTARNPLATLRVARKAVAAAAEGGKQLSVRPEVGGVAYWEVVLPDTYGLRDWLPSLHPRGHATPDARGVVNPGEFTGAGVAPVNSEVPKGEHTRPSMVEDSGERYVEEFGGPEGKYTVRASKVGDTYDIGFWLQPPGGEATQKLTGGTGGTDAVRVMRTVGEVVDRFLAARRPEKFRFQAVTSEPGRVRLYERVADALAARHGYQVSRVGKESWVEFRFVRQAPDVGGVAFGVQDLPTFYYDPSEPRLPAGQPGGGEWTATARGPVPVREDWQGYRQALDDIDRDNEIHGKRVATAHRPDSGAYFRDDRDGLEGAHEALEERVVDLASRATGWPVHRTYGTQAGGHTALYHRGERKALLYEDNGRTVLDSGAGRRVVLRHDDDDRTLLRKVRHVFEATSTFYAEPDLPTMYTADSSRADLPAQLLDRLRRYGAGGLGDHFEAALFAALDRAPDLRRAMSLADLATLQMGRARSRRNEPDLHPDDEAALDRVWDRIATTGWGAEHYAAPAPVLESNRPAAPARPAAPPAPASTVPAGPALPGATAAARPPAPPHFQQPLVKAPAQPSAPDYVARAIDRAGFAPGVDVASLAGHHSAGELSQELQAQRQRAQAAGHDTASIDRALGHLAPRPQATPASAGPRTQREVLGREFGELGAAHLAGAGGTTGASTRAAWLPGAGELSISVSHADFEMERSVRRDDQGNLVMTNEMFVVPRERQGRGLGAQIFANQVATLQRAGFHRIETLAEGQGGDPEMNGYYTWPRMGYNGPIPRGARNRLPPEYQSAQTVLDLMAMPGGRRWWKENGGAFKGVFDLTPGSRSMQVFNAYQRERAQRQQPQAGQQYGAGRAEPYATAHAPAGGTTVRGKEFAGGEFVPGPRSFASTQGKAHGAASFGHTTSGDRKAARRMARLLPRPEQVGAAARTVESRKLANRLDHRWERALHAILGGHGSGWQHVGKSAAADVFGAVKHKGGKTLPVILDGKLVTSADQAVTVRDSSRRNKLREAAKHRGAVVALVGLNLSPAASEAEKGVYLHFGAGGFTAREGAGVKKLLSHDEYRALNTAAGVRLLRERLTEALSTLDLKGYKAMAQEQADRGVATDAKNLGTSYQSAVKLGVPAEQAAQTLLDNLPPELREALKRKLAGGEDKS